MFVHKAQLVANPTADPGIVSSIQAPSHIFVDIDQEIISTVFLLLLLIRQGLLSVTSESMCMSSLYRKVWLGELTTLK